MWMTVTMMLFPLAKSEQEWDCLPPFLPCTAFKGQCIPLNTTQGQSNWRGSQHAPSLQGSVLFFFLGVVVERTMMKKERGFFLGWCMCIPAKASKWWCQAGNRIGLPWSCIKLPLHYLSFCSIAHLFPCEVMHSFFALQNVRRCKCKVGYVGNGVQCLEEVVPPIDRCLEENGQCHPDAICIDLHFQGTSAGSCPYSMEPSLSYHSRSCSLNICFWESLRSNWGADFAEAAGRRW